MINVTILQYIYNTMTKITNFIAILNFYNLKGQTHHFVQKNYSWGQNYSKFEKISSQQNSMNVQKNTPVLIEDFSQFLFSV